MSDFGSLIKANAERAKGSPPFNPRDYPDDPMAKPEHVWVMNSGVSPALPFCKYCALFTLDAQLANPETRGAGPCLQAPK